jgi:hypothetical protein
MSAHGYATCGGGDGRGSAGLTIRLLLDSAFVIDHLRDDPGAIARFARTGRSTDFRSGGDTVHHVEELGLKGMHNGVLLAAIADSATSS